MTCIEILNAAATQILDGVMFHTSMTELYGFMSLEGFYCWQKRQMFEELDSLYCIKAKTFKYMHKMLNAEPSKDQIDVVPAEWEGHSAMELKSSDIMKAVNASLEEYVKWETKAAEKFESLANEAKGLTKCWVEDLYQKTKNELAEIECLWLKLQTTNFDVKFIQCLQDEYK